VVLLFTETNIISSSIHGRVCHCWSLSYLWHTWDP